MRGKLIVLLSCTTLLVAVGIVHPQAIYAEPTTLYWASFLPKNHPETSAVQRLYIDKVNERAKGELVIEYRGGPEIMAGPDLARGVKKGVIDICTTIVGYYESIVPGVGALMLTELTPQEERKPGGLYDFVVEHHKKHGIMYLGRGAPSTERFFYFYLKKKVEKPEDFKGLKLGSATASRAAAKAWGASVTPLRISEYYTAMERNLVDGVPGCPLDTWAALGCHEVTKYVVDHPYYQGTVSLLMNLDKWNSLPRNLQDIMIQTFVEYPDHYMPWHTGRLEKARNKIKSAGVEFYKFSPEVADWFIKTTYDAAWEYQQSRFPDVTPRLKEFLTK